jgi:copper chaperone CopZ
MPIAESNSENNFPSVTCVNELTSQVKFVSAPIESKISVNRKLKLIDFKHDLADDNDNDDEEDIIFDIRSVASIYAPTSLVEGQVTQQKQHRTT